MSMPIGYEQSVRMKVVHSTNGLVSAHPRFVAQDLIDSVHCIRVELVSNLHSFHVLDDLFWSARACYDCADVWILEAPRQT